MQQLSENLIYWGGEGPIVHLAHANSFHPGTYRNLIKELTRHFKVYTSLARPFIDRYKIDDFHSFHQFAEDFITIAKSQNWNNIIGIGHSQGALTSMIAHSKNHNIFSKLIFIEPPIISAYLYPILKLIPYALAKNYVPPSKIALKRKNSWKSKEEAFHFFRIKKVFSSFTDEALWDMVNFNLESHGNKVFLKHSQYWESKIYCTIENPWPYLETISLKTMAIRGMESDVINDKIWHKWKTKTPHFSFQEIPDSGHLLPMEEPSKVSSAIINFLN